MDKVKAGSFGCLRRQLRNRVAGTFLVLFLAFHEHVPGDKYVRGPFSAFNLRVLTGLTAEHVVEGMNGKDWAEARNKAIARMIEAYSMLLDKRK
mmetsp:Transcript_37246/g.105148  ORF Transcript_37246/g.105148 Transcript_37246/m.105148 type:complete len:94 (-) Transcript_37246:26-307(-)